MRRGFDGGQRHADALVRRGDGAGMQQGLRIIGAHGIGKLRGLREDAGGVPVAAHAQNQHVGLHIMAQGKFNGGGRGFQAAFASGIVNQRQPLRGGGAVLQQVLAHQACVAVGVAGGDDALVHQRDVYPRPV